MNSAYGLYLFDIPDKWEASVSPPLMDGNHSKGSFYHLDTKHSILT